MENIIKRGRGRPAGIKSHTHFNLGQLYNLFGPNACPPVSTTWLQEQGLLNNNIVKPDISNLAIPTIEKKFSSLKVVDFSQSEE